ncbi:MAG: DegT/DnrJ/EryC1/StrS family aminotransferase, partial [Burkholderiales bacterium]
MSVSDLVRHGSDSVLSETYRRTGFNYRMTDIQAAIGLEQIKRLPLMLERRRAQAQRYTDLLGAASGIEAPHEPAYARANWQSYVVRLAQSRWQRPVMAALRAQGIATARGIMCAHLEPPYRPAWPRGCLPHSEAMRDRGLILPLFHGLGAGDQERVVAALKAAVTDAPA